VEEKLSGRSQITQPSGISPVEYARQKLDGRRGHRKRRGRECHALGRRPTIMQLIV